RPRQPRPVCPAQRDRLAAGPLSLHDALPIFTTNQAASEVQVRFSDGAVTPTYTNWYACTESGTSVSCDIDDDQVEVIDANSLEVDRKSTRLNSSHVKTSYAVFCWKKKQTGVP